MTPQPPTDDPGGGWYAVARSSDIDNPWPTMLSGRRLVVFRALDGMTYILADRCPHRGGALHRGTVAGNAIECPYHGWQWRGVDGRRVGSPAAQSATIDKTVALEAFPAVDRYGLIWTCLGQPVCGPPQFPGLGVDLCYAAAEPAHLAGLPRAPVTVTSITNGRSVLIEACSPMREGVWRIFTVTVSAP